MDKDTLFLFFSVALSWIYSHGWELVFLMIALVFSSMLAEIKRDTEKIEDLYRDVANLQYQVWSLGGLKSETTNQDHSD